ncbi:MAG: hypothetical protein FJW95_06060 [Actinobacteria bacterium]|nr:hypothetical protein [Actinomycetota bacterium]
MGGTYGLLCGSGAGGSGGGGGGADPGGGDPGGGEPGGYCGPSGGVGSVIVLAPVRPALPSKPAPDRPVGRA